jgi:hypothetical protein
VTSARGPRRRDHRLEHLRGGDRDLAGGVRQRQDLALGPGHRLEGQLDAQVTAGDHRSRRLGEDVLEVHVPDGGFDLRDDRDVACCIPDRPDVASGIDEGGSEQVETQRCPEFEVRDVLVRDDGHRRACTGEGGALVILQQAPDDDRCDHFVVGHGNRFEFDEAVCEEDLAADVHGHTVEVGNVDAGTRAEPFAREERHLLPDLELDLSTGERTDTDLRTLDVLHDRHRGVEGVGDLADEGEPRSVLIVIAMTEVEAGDIHAALDQCPDLFR